MSSLDDQLPVPKVEHSEEEEFDESASEPDDQNNTQEPAQVQKRKGGRKPVSIQQWKCGTRPVTDVALDLRDFRREKAEEQASPGGISREEDGIYQAIGDYNQTP